MVGYAKPHLLEGGVQRTHEIESYVSLKTHDFIMDRDENVAINILNRGLEKVGQGLPEYTPVEIFSGGSMNQEATQLVGW